MDYPIIQIDEKTWRIEDGDVRFFVLEGDEKALLIDSGMSVHNAKEIAQTLTSKPIELANTHADIDHVGSNEEFDKVYMNLCECANYHKKTDVIPLWEGDILDLGNRPLKVIFLPGHTTGSIGFLDINRRALFSGDPIQDGRIFLFGPMRSLQAYLYSLERLKQFTNEFDVIYPSHGTFPVYNDLIDKLVDGARKVYNKEIKPTPAQFKDIPLDEYDIQCASLLLNKEEKEHQ